jgi:Fe-S-cluster-containing hydrogenase component 2
MVPNQQPTDFIRNYSANKNRSVLDRSESSMEQWAAAPAKFINLATKCDLCIGRSAGPACVQMCPHGSAVRISFKDLETVARTLG